MGLDRRTRHIGGAGVQARGQIQGQHLESWGVLDCIVQHRDPGFRQTRQGQTGAQTEQAIHDPPFESGDRFPGLGGMPVAPAQSLPELGLQGGVPSPQGPGLQGPDLHLGTLQPRQTGQGQGVAAVVAGTCQHVDGRPFGNQLQGAQGGMLLEQEGGNAPPLDGRRLEPAHLLSSEQRGRHGFPPSSRRDRVRLVPPAGGVLVAAAPRRLQA